MSKKNTKKPASTVSSQFARAVARVLRTLCKDGDAVPGSVVAEHLAKSKEFDVGNRQLLNLMVNQAVSEGSVPGYFNIKGRSGGIYNVAQREAWNRNAA